MVRNLDFFYFYAKKEKFRSRAAFKLIELNRKFRFLEKTRGVLDLCCAPGSWLEVARIFSPQNALLIGVDIKYSKPLQKCKIVRGDITSPGCKEVLKKLIDEKKGKIDVVLHDGAPKMGTNWERDSYNQNDLTLKALSLAWSCLEEDGHFVTKVFRSKFLNRILFVLNHLFEKINFFKPSASRGTSAEIFLVCSKFKPQSRPEKNLFNSSYIFGSLEKNTKTSFVEKKTRFLTSNLNTNSILEFLRNKSIFCKFNKWNFSLNNELESLIGIGYFGRIDFDSELEIRKKKQNKVFVFYFFYWARFILEMEKKKREKNNKFQS